MIDLKEKLVIVRNIVVNRRTALHALIYEIDIPLTSLWRLYKNGELIRHSNSLKPLLTLNNQLRRFDNGQFQDMFDYIHTHLYTS